MRNIKVIYDNSVAVIEGNLEGIEHYILSAMSYNHKLYKKIERKYAYDKRTKTFPTGLLSEFVKVMKGLNINYELVDNRKYPKNKIDLKWKHPYKLRDYQIEAVEKAVKCTRGRIRLPTGSGKNLTYMWLINNLKVKTLIVVNTIEALNDTHKEGVKAFGELNVGRIGDKNRVKRNITIITGKSLSMANLDDFRDFEMVIFDEAHRVASSGWLKSAYKLDCFYKFGGSGTQFSTDGQDLLLTAALGRVIYKVPTKFLQDEKYLVDSKYFL